MLLDDRHCRLRLDRLQQIPACQVIELPVQDVLQVAVTVLVRVGVVIGAIPKPLHGAVDVLANSGFGQDELAVIVLIHVQHAARQHAFRLQPRIELPLHQAAIHAGIRLGQLVGADAITEVLHHELFKSALIAAPDLSVWWVVEQITLGIVDGLLVGERRGRQERDAGSCFSLCRVNFRFHFVLLGLQEQIQRLDARFMLGILVSQCVPHLVHCVVQIHDLVVRRNLVDQLTAFINLVSVQSGITVDCAARVHGDGPQFVDRQRVLAVCRLHQIVGFIRHHQVPLAAHDVIVLSEVGVGRNDDAAPGVFGILQAIYFQLQILAGSHPIGSDLVRRNQNQDVLFALALKTLDDAQAGIGLAGAGAIGE